MISPPKVIDLFSGVGGLSLSATKAGFHVAAAVEKEKRIIDSHSKNFPNSIHICSDISIIKGKDLSTKQIIGKSDLAGLIGGPPCQGFSSIGNGLISDERNLLFSHFFRLASELKPAFFLAENVPGIMNPKYDEIRKNALKLVENDYDIIEPLKVVANEFGAATTRTRFFFIGIRKDCNGASSLLEKIKLLKEPKGTVVIDALSGLPSDISEEWQDYKSSWQKITSIHLNKYTDSINEIYDGIGNAKAIERLIKDNEVSGCFGTKHSLDVAKRYKDLLPGQQDKISKSQKLNAQGYCPTLRAGTDSTKGSFQAVRPIHPFLPRVITPREAARLQGFPDWFQFHETKWHSFRQIGNSVCPIAASKVLSALKIAVNM